MRISIDIDDVLGDFVGAFCIYQCTNHDESTNFEEVVSYDLPSYFERFDGNYGKFKEALYEFAEENTFADLEPIEGAIEGVKQLMDDGHEIYFITSRTSKAIHDTYQWFLEHELPLHNLYFERDKGWLGSILGIELHIDDAPHNIESMRKRDIDGILFARPWNKHTDYPRAENWENLLEMIDEYGRSTNL